MSMSASFTLSIDQFPYVTMSWSGKSVLLPSLHSTGSDTVRHISPTISKPLTPHDSFWSYCVMVQSLTAAFTVGLDGLSYTKPSVTLKPVICGQSTVVSALAAGREMPPKGSSPATNSAASIIASNFFVLILSSVSLYDLFCYRITRCYGSGVHPPEPELLPTYPPGRGCGSRLT